MAYLPIFLDVTGRRCLVVGGGDIAARKAGSLLEAGAEVTVVSPSLIEPLAELVRAGRIIYTQRRYEAGDMTGAALVYAATDDPALHERLFVEARQHSIPINVADVPSLCTFIAPATMTRGSLQIAVSTGGASPAMARRIIARIERLFGAEYGLTLEVLRAARHHLRATEPDIRMRAAKLTTLAASRIPEYLRKGNLDALDTTLLRELGVDLATLGLSRLRSDPTRAEETSTPR